MLENGFDLHFDNCTILGLIHTGREATRHAKQDTQILL